MAKEKVVIKDGINYLISVSDIFESIRKKFKDKEDANNLIKVQEHLDQAIKHLKLVETSIKKQDQNEFQNRQEEEQGE